MVRCVRSNWTRWNAEKLWMPRFFFRSIPSIVSVYRGEGGREYSMNSRGMLSSHNYSFLYGSLTPNVNKQSRTNPLGCYFILEIITPLYFVPFGPILSYPLPPPSFHPQIIIAHSKQVHQVFKIVFYRNNFNRDK